MYEYIDKKCTCKNASNNHSIATVDYKNNQNKYRIMYIKSVTSASNIIST